MVLASHLENLGLMRSSLVSWSCRTALACVCLLVLCAFIGNGQDVQFVWQNPLPQGNTLRDIHIFNNKSMIAVGDAGTVMRTDNGGENWSIQHYTGDISGVLWDVHFTDRNTGWIAGEGGLIHTDDGGVTWHSLESMRGKYLRSVFFHDHNTGWIADYPDSPGYYDYGRSIMTTLDGGLSWTNKVEQIRKIIFLQAVDDSIVWGVGNDSYGSVVMKSDNGGKNWSYSFSTGEERMYGGYFLDAFSGWIVGTGYTILRLEPPKTSWVDIRQSLPQPNFPSTGMTPELVTLYSVHFIDKNTGWIVGTYGNILHTTDGGRTWEVQASPDANTLYCVRFLDVNLGWAVGAYGTIIKTENGGKTWQKLSKGSTANLRSIHFSDVQNGWAVGEYGTILHTSDGGNSWIEQNAGVTNSLNAVDVLDFERAVIAGGGVIVITRNSGKTWEITESGNLRDVCFPESSTHPDLRHGWAVGGSSTLLKSLNGGVSWQRLPDLEYGWLAKVIFTDELIGWVVDDGGSLLRTSDGGESWFVVPDTPLIIMDSVYFIKGGDGWLMGSTSEGTNGLFRTTNSGTTWRRQTNFKSNTTCNSIFFLDDRNGWIVGERGVAFRTADSIWNWRQYRSNTLNRLISVHFPDYSTGWVVGDGGTIIKIRDYQFNVTFPPDRIRISPNFPNPFNISTTFSYFLSRDGKVDANVFNINGQKVADIYSGYQPAGSHTLTWAPAGISSGIYFFRIEQNGLRATAKCVYIK